MTASINLSLPANIWSKTISFLAPEQQLVVSQVSKLWRKASCMPICRLALMQSIARLPEKERSLFLVKHPQLIEHLIALKFNEVLGFSSKIIGEFLSKVIECKFKKDIPSMISFLEKLPEDKRTMIKSLNFLCGHDRDFADAQVVQVIALCPALTSLTLLSSNTTGRWLTQVSKENKLEDLCISDCNLNEEFLIEFFSSRAINLRTVDLSYTNTTGEGLTHLPKNNQLESLHLNACTNLDENLLEIFFSKAAHLKKVDLSRTYTSLKGFSQIPAKNQVEELYLGSCEFVKEIYLIEFLSLKASHLRVLDLSFTQTKGEGLTYIPEKNQLEELYLGSCKFVKEIYLIEFLSLKASHLRVLDLSFTQTTGEGLTYIPEKNQLEELLLGSCKKLDETFIGRFFSLKAAHLRRVNLFNTSITGEGLTHISAESQLEELYLTSCKFVEEIYLIEFFSLKASHLRMLDLDFTNTTGEGLACIPKKNQLEKILLRSCHELDESFLAKFFSLKASHLRSVDLSNTSITGEGLACISKKNQLEELLLGSCKKLDEYFLKWLFIKAFHLKKADLSDTNITGEGLIQIPRNQLVKLLLMSCKMLDESLLGRFFSSKAAYLKHVDLRYTNITGVSLTYIPPKNELKYLYLDGRNLNWRLVPKIKG